VQRRPADLRQEPVSPASAGLRSSHRLR